MVSVRLQGDFKKGKNVESDTGTSAQVFSKFPKSAVLFSTSREGLILNFLIIRQLWPPPGLTDFPLLKSQPVSVPRSLVFFFPFNLLFPSCLVISVAQSSASSPNWSTRSG